TNRGRFLAEFRTPSGTKFSRQFNKDASNYYLELRPSLLSLTPSPQQNQLSITLSGELGRTFQIETSTNMSTWSILKTVTNFTGDVQFTVTNALSPGPRLYHARALP